MVVGLERVVGRDGSGKVWYDCFGPVVRQDWVAGTLVVIIMQLLHLIREKQRRSTVEP